MALGITDLKKGTLIEIDGQPYQVLDYLQKQMGRGGSIVNTKLKNLLTANVVDKTFKGSDNINLADVANQNTAYLYNDGEKFYFMNDETFEQFEISKALVGEFGPFLTEGLKVIIQLFNGNPINIGMPKNVWLKVTEAHDVVKGDTSNAVTKDIVLETGLEIKAPAFIKVGDVISVDTETRAYRERKK
jgi:elongation factor P